MHGRAGHDPDGLGTFAHGPNPDNRQLRIVDAPNWVREDLFDVEGVPPGNATLDQTYGPMLQSLLGERFKLKVRPETRDIPVYALSFAPGGPKLKTSKEGSCVPIDLSHPPARPSLAKHRLHSVAARRFGATRRK